MPFSIIWRLKVSHCIVISGQETRDLGKTLFLKHHLLPWPPDSLARNERKQLSSQFVESEDAGEGGLLKSQPPPGNAARNERPESIYESTCARYCQSAQRN